MTTYELPDGRRLVLVAATLEEWAEAAQAQMLRVGCSVDYAAAYAALIRKAVRP